MTLPFPSSPVLGENIATSIDRIEQNLEYLDDALTTSTMKLINKTYDMATTAGAVAITGVGFTPASIVVFAMEYLGEAHSWGASDATSNMCTYSDYSVASGSSSTKLLYLLQAAGDSQEAVLTSYDSDGATLTFTKTGTPTGNMALILLFMG